MDKKMLKKINNLEQWIFMQMEDILKVFDLMVKFKASGMLEEPCTRGRYLEEFSCDIYNRMRRLMSSVIQLGTVCENMGPFSYALDAASRANEAVTTSVIELLRNNIKNKSITRTSIEDLSRYINGKFGFLRSDIEQVVNDVRKELEE